MIWWPKKPHGKNLERIWPSYSQGKPKSTMQKNQSSYRRTTSFPLDFLMLPTNRIYWHDHVQAPNPRIPSFLDSSIKYKHPHLFFFKLQWQQPCWSSRYWYYLQLENPKFYVKESSSRSHKRFTQNSNVWATIQLEQPKKTWLEFSLNT